MIDPRISDALRARLVNTPVDWRNAYAAPGTAGGCRVFPEAIAELCSEDAIEPLGLATIGSPLEPMRAEPAHRSELISEARGGEFLTLILEEGDWALVQTEDDYVGWVARWSLRKQGAEERDELRGRLLGHFDRPLGTLWDSDSWASSPLVLGTPLLRPADTFAERGGQHLVELPWGAKGWLPAEHVGWKDEHPRREGLPRGATLLLGTPYRWGGRSAASLDCSGYVQLVFEREGLRLPRDSSQQSAAGRELPLDPAAWAAGDLLFFGEPADHVGIFDGRGALLHCRAEVRRQKLEELPELMERLSAARRMEVPSADATLWLPAAS